MRRSFGAATVCAHRRRGPDGQAFGHLSLARDDIDREDVRGAVSALFYAAEAAITAISEAHSIDIYAGPAAALSAKLAAGDDFVQWTLRCGCILHDDGTLRAAAANVIDQRLWPDGSKKLGRLPELCSGGAPDLRRRP